MSSAASLASSGNAYRSDTLSARQLLTRDQIEMLALLLEDLCTARHAGERFRDWPEVVRLMTGAYACGFVCKDMTHVRPHHLDNLLRDPPALSRATLKELRRFVHMLMRAERWSDGGDDLGGGFIHQAWADGALRIVAVRLRAILEEPIHG